MQFIQYKLEASPTPSDEEDVSSDEEEDAFGPKKEKVEEDPVKSKKMIPYYMQSFLIKYSYSGAKQMAEKAMNDPMAMVNNVSSLKFW